METILYHENMQRGSREFPVSYYYVDSKHPKYQMIAHWHNDYEIIRVLRGRLELKLNCKIFVLKEDDSIFIPGNIMHSAEPNECVYECIVFSKSIFGASAKCKHTAKGFDIAMFNGNDDINKLFNVFEHLCDGDEFMAISLIYKLSYEVLKQNGVDTIVDNKSMYKIKPAISIIEEEYGTKITLEEMAEACGMSPSYFSRRFKEITGQTPFEYLLAYRVEVACEMLLEGSENVTEICYKCGFNDLSYFINVFKKHMGISPKNYAMNYRL